MIELFVPGRLCLFGEHSDWAGTYRTVDPTIDPGLCITTGTGQGIRSVARQCRGRFRAQSMVRNHGEPNSIDIAFRPAALAAAAERGGFWSYAAGTALAMLRAQPVDGLQLACTGMDLPMGKGLSSSAAICVTVARAFNRLYDLGMSNRDEMEIAYRGETSTPSRCGRMDQVCAFGQTTNLLTFDGEEMKVEPVDPGGEFHVLVVDLGGTKDTVKILRDLHACFFDRRDRTASGVRRALGPINGGIARAARAALERGEASTLGSLMREAQEVFDRLVAPACPDQLLSPLLHRVLCHPALHDLVHGGKGVGSQGDGCAQLVCRGAPERAAAGTIIRSELGMASLELTVEPVTPSRGGRPAPG